MSTTKEFNEITSKLIDDVDNINFEHLKLFCPFGIGYSEKLEIFNLYEKIKSTEFFKKVFDNKFSRFLVYASKMEDWECFKDLVLEKANIEK